MITGEKILERLFLKMEQDIKNEAISDWRLSDEFIFEQRFLMIENVKNLIKYKIITLSKFRTDAVLDVKWELKNIEYTISKEMNDLAISVFDNYKVLFEKIKRKKLELELSNFLIREIDFPRDELIDDIKFTDIQDFKQD